MRTLLTSRTITHHNAGVPPIDPARLQKAMNGAPITPVTLAKEVGVSVQYICDMLSGRRRLKRNPTLRKKIATVIGVPTDWIEAPAAVEQEAS